MPRVEVSELSKLDGYPYVVVSWVDDDGYPVSVATTFQTDATRREVILRVPKYDFAWQTDYWLAEPLVLPKGSKIHVSAHFDNSPANLNNPDPKATVRWGDQTWEEMMIGFFTYTVEGRSSTASARK